MIVIGPMPVQLHTSPAPTVPFLDIDLSTVPAAGIALAPSGDYAMRGEVATLEKVIWAAVLTPLGSIDWDPRFGAQLAHKRLAPSDLAAEKRRLRQLIEGIPHVTHVDVQILFDADEARLALAVESDFGAFTTGGV